MPYPYLTPQEQARIDELVSLGIQANQVIINELRTEIAKLRSALKEVQYRIEQCSMWNGQATELTGMHPRHQQKVLDIVDAAL